MAIVLRSRLLDEAGFAHAFSTRSGGVSEAPFDSLNLARSVGDDPAHVAENRARFAAAGGFADRVLFGVSQVHGDRTVVVRAGDDVARVADEEADAIVATRESGAAVGVRVADCVPVLIAARDRGTVAAVHAGWRGVVRGVIESAIRAMRDAGCDPHVMVAAIGPHIRVGAFEVGPEVASEIDAAVPAVDGLVVEPSAGGKPHVDLALAVTAQLVRSGMSSAAIDDVGGCTWTERDRFFSFRRDGKRSGRLVGAIATLVGATVLAVSVLDATAVHAQDAVSTGTPCDPSDVWCAADADADGVLDTIDACDDQPEDHDDLDDLDGCPDPDDDHDGIPDSDDACPDLAEDRDAPRPDDGCPDGVPDRPRRSRRGARDDAAIPSDGASDADLPDGAPRPLDWLQVAFGIADAHRSLDVHVSGEAGAHVYRTPSAGYPEAGIEASVYLPPVPWLGATLVMWHSLAIGTNGCGETMDGACPASSRLDIDTSSVEVLGALAFRYRFGASSRAAIATGSIGIGQYAFTLDPMRTAALDPATAIESHRYTYVAFEAGLDLTLAPPVLSATLAGLYRVGIEDVGRAAKARFGDDAGSGDHHGFGVRAGLRVALPFVARGLFVALRVDWMHFEASFAGTNADETYTTASSSDDVLRAALLVGATLR